MLCFPGLTPVANDAQAVGDSGECVVESGRTAPVDARREKCGSWPAFIHRFRSPGSRPSKPRISSLGLIASPAGWPPQAAAITPAVQTRPASSAPRGIQKGIEGGLYGPCASIAATQRANVPLDVRFLGIDYGARRIGLALSDPTGLLARPWKTLARTGSRAQIAATLADEIARLAGDADGLAGVVLGFPRTLGGEPTHLTAEVTALAEALRVTLSVPLVLQDERLSSREAEQILARRLKDWRQRKPLLDAASAAVILQDYLDGRTRLPGPVAEDTRS